LTIKIYSRHRVVTATAKTRSLTVAAWNLTRTTHSLCARGCRCATGHRIIGFRDDLCNFVVARQYSIFKEQKLTANGYELKAFGGPG